MMLTERATVKMSEEMDYPVATRNRELRRDNASTHDVSKYIYLIFLHESRFNFIMLVYFFYSRDTHEFICVD